MISDSFFERQLDVNNSNRTCYKKKLLNFCYDNAEYLYKTEIEVFDDNIKALKFSKNGNLMAAADSSYTLIWNLNSNDVFPDAYNEIEKVFGCSVKTLTFNQDSSKIYSGGDDFYLEDDYYLFVNDILTGLIIEKPFAHNKIIDITSCPKNSNLVIFASENKSLYLYDSRNLGKITEQIFKFEHKFKSIEYHPWKDHLLLLTTCSGNAIYNFDLRNHQLVHNYYLPFNNKNGVSYSKFNREGNQIIVTRKGSNPLLYNFNDSYPVYEFSEFGYNNYLKTKKCCFGGPSDEFVITGSDNFNVYIWEIPKNKKNNEVIEKVNSAKFTLRGHKSIVNGIDYNPQKSMLASYDIERNVLFWSPFSFTKDNDPENFSNDTSHEEEINFSQFSYMYEFICINNFLSSRSLNYWKEDYFYNKNIQDFDLEKDLDIKFIKSSIFNAKNELKFKKTNLLIKINEFLEQKFMKNFEGLDMKKLNILLEIEKVYQTKNFFDITINCLKKHLRFLKKKIIANNSKNEELISLKNKKLTLETLLLDLKNIIEQNKDLYESSNELVRKRLEVFKANRYNLYR